jgi:predicted ferric reductase
MLEIVEMPEAAATESDRDRLAPPTRDRLTRSAEVERGGLSAATIRRRVLLTLLGAGLVVMLGFWWQQTNGNAVTGTTNLLTAGGRLAGLIGGYLLLVQVLLMSRVPVIERAVSGARKSRWHRDLGGYVVTIICLHVLLVTLGYAEAAGTGWLHEVWVVLTTYQDMISAAIAFGIMVAAAVIGLRSLRKRLPYGLWHALHAAVYLVLLLVYGHQFADGQQFVLSRAARVYWAVLYISVVVALVYGRVVVPVRLNLRHDLRVDGIVPEVPGVVSIYVTGARLDELGGEAGQYTHWRTLTRDGWWRAHPFSLSAAPNGKWLRLTVKAVGDRSRELQQLAPGTRVWIDRPTGEFTAEHRERAGALLIAAGSGIAPVRALMEDLPPGTVVVFRARTREELIFRAELDRLAEARGMQVWYVLGRRTDPEPARLFTAAGLTGLVPDIRARDVYICGPDGLATHVVDVLAELRVPPRQIHTDQFEL